MEYDLDTTYRTAQRALDALDEMTYTDDRIESTKTLLEQAVEATGEDAYDNLDRAYTRLSNGERSLEGQILEDPTDHLRIRTAVCNVKSGLEGFESR